ncbi:hypothetical protein AB0K00_52120 [Dactylosporangium sp. NPDC049525]|uniref:hypothetical protein n=1 Tax=Dactylosporangium sp. NPDC049525 TaxID=3154730 RepID=UPI0034228652
MKEADTELVARQAALQADGARLLARLDRLGPLAPTGSFVSGLMVWRDLDVMLLGGPSFGPRDVLALLDRVVDLPDLTGFDYVDERGDRSPTGQRRDERFHVALRVGAWRVDLSIWLHDDHADVTAYHRGLAASLTGEQRLRILRIKDVWHRRPEYPDEVSGFEIYTAVLEHGVATPEEFEAWLRPPA